MNPPLTPPLRGELIALWTDVANAGGAVGVVAPASVEEVTTLAAPAFTRVESGADDLAVAFDGDQPVGLGFLETNDVALTAHWATVRRLQRDPKRSGEGIGAALLAALEDAARRRGLAMVTLTVRGGTGRERFYLAHGYRMDARLPDRLQVAGGLTVDELRLSKPLPARAAGPDATQGRVTTTDGDAAIPLADRATGRGTVPLPVRPLDPELPLPRYAHPGDAGLDLHARTTVTVEPGGRTLVPTGVAVAIPPGHVGLVHPRSGLAVRHGLTVLNAPGTIDAGYRGEIQVALVNTDRDEPVTIERGARVAQLVLQRVETAVVQIVETLPASERGAGGFGSTGR